MKKFVLYVDHFADYNKADVMFEIEAKTEREALKTAQDLIYSDYTNDHIYLVRVYQNKRDKQTKSTYLERLFNIRSHGSVDIFCGDGEVIPYTTEKFNGVTWYTLHGYYTALFPDMQTGVEEMKKAYMRIDSNK